MLCSPRTETQYLVVEGARKSLLTHAPSWGMNERVDRQGVDLCRLTLHFPSAVAAEEGFGFVAESRQRMQVSFDSTS